MGNADFRSLAVIDEVPFADLEGDVVAVDAHNWLYKYLTTTVQWTRDDVYTTEGGVEVANLVGIVQGLPKFLENDLTPVFVWDGGVTELKDEEIEERRQQREAYEEQLEEAKAAGEGIEAARLEARTQRLTETIHETSRELFDLLGVPQMEAPAEGEAQAAHMARVDDDIDYAGSDDYDCLLLGAPVTLRQLTSKGAPERMDFAATLDEHDVTWEQLVDVGILCGTDFNEGLAGFGPKTAMQAVHEHGDLWSVLDAEDEHIEFADRIRELFLNPDVVDDYDVRMDVTPDMDGAREYVVNEWEVDADEVERGFSRIDEAVTQTGLDQWT